MKKKLYEALVARMRASTLESYAIIEEILDNPLALENPMEHLERHARNLAEAEGTLLTLQGYFDKLADSQIERNVLRNIETEKFQRMHQVVSAIENHLRPAQIEEQNPIRVVDAETSPTFKRSQKEAAKKKSRKKKTDE